MSTKLRPGSTKTLKEVVDFAATQLTAANILNGHVHVSNQPSAYLQVRRAFSIEGALNVDFRFDTVDKVEVWVPRVSVNFPACNKGIIEATAFLHLVQELTMLAATIQVQLDEFHIPLEV